MARGVPKGYSQFELPTMGGENKQIFDLLRSQFMQSAPGMFSQLGGLAQGNQQAFEQFEAPAMRQFQQQILPGIANRYVGSGIGGSSGMQNAFAGAGKEFAEDLHSQRLALQLNSMARLMGLGDLLLQTPTSQFGLAQKPQGLGSSFFSALGHGAGTALGMAPMMFGL